MKQLALVFLAWILMPSCSTSNQSIMLYTQSDIQNEQLKNYDFLKGMYQDAYFPDVVVDKCKNVLVKLCLDIEKQQPNNLDALYKLTHAATNQINDLEDDFYENGSEIETAAREVLAEDFHNIAKFYDFDNADIEELIATRDW